MQEAGLINCIIMKKAKELRKNLHNILYLPSVYYEALNEILVFPTSSQQRLVLGKMENAFIS